MWEVVRIYELPAYGESAYFKLKTIWITTYNDKLINNNNQNIL